jgi:predicted Zn-dependent peptidase
MTLPSGVRLIHAFTPSPVVYCGYAIDAGSRDELPGEQGLAHYVEHMIFKGTTHRRAWHILNRMEAVGGDLNAFTNKEETMVYCAHLPADLPRAMELLTDIVFHSTFPQEEMEREVEVIVDEIQSYEDTPSELIFDEFDELLFPAHPLGRNILGRAEELRRYTSQDLKRFVGRLYRPERMVFFVQGPVEFSKVKRLAERLIGEDSIFGIEKDNEEAIHQEPAEKAVPQKPTESPLRQAPAEAAPVTVTRPRDTHQAHVIFGSRAYHAKDPRRTSLYLLTNILGGPGMNSRLNVALRERSGLVYNVEANLTSYTDTGAFTVYYGCDPEDADRCRQLARKELNRLCQAPLSSTQLRAAKRQLIGQIGVTQDNYENLALDMAKLFLHYDHCEQKEQVFHRIEALTEHDLWMVANEVWREEGLSELGYSR